MSYFIVSKLFEKFIPMEILINQFTSSPTYKRRLSSFILVDEEEEEEEKKNMYWS